MRYSFVTGVMKKLVIDDLCLKKESEMFVGFFWFVGQTCGRRRRKAEETAVKAMAAVAIFVNFILTWLGFYTLN